MKKLILSALVAVAAISANAQYWIGGNISLNSVKAYKGADAETIFTFDPEVGYKFNDKWSIGVNLTYKSNASKELNGAEDSYSTRVDYNFDDFDFDIEDYESETSTPAYFGLKIFGRYNIFKTGIATFFVDGGIGLNFWNNSVGTDFSIGIRPGVSIAASEKISLITKLGYIGYEKQSDKRGGATNIGLGVESSAVSFGVLYNF